MYTVSIYWTRTAESLEWRHRAIDTLMFELVSFFFFSFSSPFLLVLLSLYSIGCCCSCCCLFAIRFGFVFHSPCLVCTQHVAATGETNASLCVCILNFSPQFKPLISPLNLNSALKTLETHAFPYEQWTKCSPYRARFGACGVIGTEKWKTNNISPCEHNKINVKRIDFWCGHSVRSDSIEFFQHWNMNHN